MYVQFPPDSRTTRVDDDTIRELTADTDNPDGHPITRDGPEDDSAIQVTAELGQYLIDAWGFVENGETEPTSVETTDTAEADDDAAAEGGA